MECIIEDIGIIQIIAAQIQRQFKIAMRNQYNTNGLSGKLFYNFIIVISPIELNDGLKLPLILYSRLWNSVVNLVSIIYYSFY